MLRALRNQRRFLTFVGDKRRYYLLESSQIHNYSSIRHHAPLVKAAQNSSTSRIFSPFKPSDRVRENPWKSIYAKNFYSLAKNSNNSSSTKHYARFPWKGQNHSHSFSNTIFAPIRIFDSLKASNVKNFHARSNIGYFKSFSPQLARKHVNFIRPYTIFPPISKLACATSLSFTRYHLVPGILAFFVAEAACAQSAWAEGEYSNTSDGFYSTAQDGYVYVSSILYSIYEAFLLFLRTIYLTVLFSPSIAMAPFADTFGPEFRTTWLHIVHVTLETAGPAFIKWGQWAATRPDLFPKDLCVELAKLHSKAPAHSFAYSKLTIEKAFGRELHDIFERFEETPVASGSIAQVHRASLSSRYPGQKLSKPIEVAVKVRHPGVGELIRRDFEIINLVAKASSFIPGLSWLRLDESVRQFVVFMMSQVDLAREAAHLSRFIYNFRKWKNVSFPKPLYPLVHPSVLVETFEHGDGISLYVDGVEGNDRIKRDLAHIGTHALLKMLLVDNLVHADMHPGNILVRAPKGKRSRKKLLRAKPHIIFLDIGMTAELSKNDRTNLVEFFKAVAVRDGCTAAKCALNMSKKQRCPDPKAFIEELDKNIHVLGHP